MTQRQRRRPPERGYARRRPPQRRLPAQDARRRSNARRSAPKRRRRVGRWLLAVPVVALLIWFLLTHYVFLIRNVQVVGAGDMSEADVVRLSGIPLGGRLNAVDQAALRAKLESTGRLAFVSAERKYPDTIVLTVRQRSRDAITLQAGKLLVLDSDGYVVSVGDVAPEDGVPYVMGLKSSTYRLGKQIDDADDGWLQRLREVGVQGLLDLIRGR